MISLLNSVEDKEKTIETYREAVHDLRNSASYFNSMIDDYRSEHQSPLSSCEKSFISLYELINFRLDILHGDIDLTSVIEKHQKIHPLVVKLYHILKYKAEPKKVNVHISANQANSFMITKSLYLSLFILMENAIKYAKPQTFVNIDFEEDDNKTVIIIKNVSEKITEDADYLLIKGNRGSNAQNSGKLGSGFGLAMSSEFLKKTNAKLEIELDQKDKETTIFYTKISLFNPVQNS